MQSQKRLTFIALNVSDLAKSLQFYRDVLGLPLDDASHDSDLNDPWYGGEHAAHSWTDGAFIHFALYPALEPHRPTTKSVQVGFYVHEFEAIHIRVVRSGAAVVQEPRVEPWGKTARYLDPDGNIVSITAVSAPKGQTRA